MEFSASNAGSVWAAAEAAAVCALLPWACRA